MVVDKDKKTGKEETLKEVCHKLGIDRFGFSIDALDMHAHQETFHRFDKFNLKYNPLGKAQLRTIFLKLDNYIKGKFLAEVTKEVFEDLSWSKYQMAEYRLSIYGKKKTEWDTVAAWVCDNRLKSAHVKWMIQVPRIYPIFKKFGMIESFGDMLQNVFEPLFEVTINPSSHPKLHLFLQTVVGFDSVDDESQPEQKRKRYPSPDNWNMNENPPYMYVVLYCIVFCFFVFCVLFFVLWWLWCT